MDSMNCTNSKHQICPETNCRRELQALLHEVNRQLWHTYKTDPEYLADADLYTITILCLFASVILVLMVRSIKPSESVDDQVTILLNSMRVRVEFEDNARQRQKLREAKRKAQRWLAEAKQRSCKKLSFSGSFRLRTKSDSDALQGSSSVVGESPPENISMKSNPIQIISSPFSSIKRKKSSSTSAAPYQPHQHHQHQQHQQHSNISMTTSIPIQNLTTTATKTAAKTFPRKPIIYQRAASYQFLPEIVVTSTHQNEDSSSIKGYNRVPTSQSYDDDSEDGGGGPSTSCVNLLPTNLVICLLITPILSAIILFACGKSRSPGGSNGKRSSSKKKQQQQSKVPKEGLSEKSSRKSRRNVKSAEQRSTQLESSKKETTTSNSDKNKKLKSKMLVAPEDQTPRRRVKKGSSKTRRENPSEQTGIPQQPPLSSDRNEISKEQTPAAQCENGDPGNNNNNEADAPAQQNQEPDKQSPYEQISPSGKEVNIQFTKNGAVFCKKFYVKQATDAPPEAPKKEEEQLKAVPAPAAEEQQRQNDENVKVKDAGNKDGENENDEEEESDDSKKEKKKSKKKKKKDKKSKKKKKKSKKSKKERSEKEKPKKVEATPARAALAPTQYENLSVYPRVLNEPKPSQNDKGTTFMSKMNQNITGATATEDMGFEVTTDTYLTGVNPRKLKSYLNQKGPTMLTGYANNDGDEVSVAPPSLKLDPTMHLSVKEQLETAKPKSAMTELQLQETQELQASQSPTVSTGKQLDKTQENRYFQNSDNPPLSLSTTQDLTMKPMLQRTQTHLETTQRGDETVTTQQSHSKFVTGLEGEVTGLPRSETQGTESTQTLAKVASLTPIETTQRSTHNQISETQPTTKATQKTQTVAAPLVTAIDYEKPVNNDEYQSLTMPSSEHQQQQQQLPGARITLNEKHTDKKYPKPKVFPKNDKEQKIAKYGLKARNDEYPTFKDIESDWGTEALDEKTAKPSAMDEFLKSKIDDKKIVKNDANDKKPKAAAADATEKKEKENVEAEREAKRAAEEERIGKLRANAPKPKVLKRNSWEEKIAEGKVFRRKHEYPTMNDVMSDWESKESSERDSKDPPPGTPPPTSSPGTPSSGKKTSPGPSTRPPGTGIPKKGSITKSKAAHDDL